MAKKNSPLSILNYPLSSTAFIEQRRKNTKLYTLNYPLDPQGRFRNEMEKELLTINYRDFPLSL